ncbi:helix-turn-helix domain-containing protein [Calothrix sp. 336/3]|uniref:helix-turn-helix domain-containing protein n=1 Tax=Calothrix sp. 336/3 TaxID=1337936 RepID=UPI0004E384E0|nr:helix-turn-helix domain-containing protein [Calothrix sp. 336/3]AKG20478.1 helix-turn-helix domain-containing protein [Calothrix sp. 336/3]
MRESDKVQSSEEGKARLKQAYKEAKLTQEELASQANVSVDTVKRLLGTKDCPNGVERQAVKNIAKVLKMEPTDIVDVKDWYPQRQLPPEFERLIYEKTELFCGRKFVFDAIEDFLQNNPNGYFTIIGDAGMGKSAISAKYVLDNPETICFFNIRAEGNNRPEIFLKRIRQQLIARFQLLDVADADLSILLTKAKEKLFTGERLIIVVDALDEVDQEGTANILYLPTILPDGVYFVLTRRPYNQNEKRLNLSPSTPTQELDLREKIQESVQDVKEYIRELLADSKYQQGLVKWIEQQDHMESHISCEYFVEIIAVNSENNFMYLRCILPAIAEGYYHDKPLDELPVGLQGYYENHWHIMGMTAKPLPKNKIKIVYVMCALRSAASREVIAKYSKQNALTVQEVLDGWAQFLQKQEIYQPPRYRFYHESFRDFLHRRDIVQAAGINLPDISAEVAKNMTEGVIL